MHIKQNYVFNYIVDSVKNAKICGSADIKECNGGEEKKQINFPGPSAYWTGDRKGIINFICWNPKIDDKDFNLQIEVKSVGYQIDTKGQETLKQESSCNLNCHCEGKGLDND